MNKRVLIIFSVVFIAVIGIFFSINNSVRAYWDEDENGRRYTNEDGEYSIGFTDIDECLYYFDEDGYLKTGKFYVEDKDAYYYADENGVIQIGVIDTEDVFFITEDDGRIKTGLVDYEGVKYYFNTNAEYVVGWYKNGDDWFYGGEKGRVVIGFETINGYRYYFDENGARVHDTIMTIDDTTYIFNSDGSIDENATMLYPVFVYINDYRKEHGLSEISLDTKVSACAVLRASSLVNGFADDGDVKRLIQDCGIKCEKGYEFSYGGQPDYSIDMLTGHIKLDNNFIGVLNREDINCVGLGSYMIDNVYYYDILFIQK
ncbi:MAG: hypothetical protein K6G76_08095 [Lachnospiraceae bacterium]|nr:hypothetical protein [Lachnospiraceae bacterium]